MLTIEDIQDGSEFYDETIDSLDGRGLDLVGKEFNGCRFQSCQFLEANLSRCKFIDCVLTACDWSNAVVKGCTFRDVAFADSKLLGVNWTQAAVMAHVAFRRSVLNFNNFRNMDLRKLVLAECRAHESDFTHAILVEADCRASDFQGSTFAQTDLSKADFRQAKNYQIRVRDNRLEQAKFSLPEAMELLYGLDIILEH